MKGFNLDVSKEIDLLKDSKKGKSMRWDEKEEDNVPETSEKYFFKKRYLLHQMMLGCLVWRELIHVFVDKEVFGNLW